MCLGCVSSELIIMRVMGGYYYHLQCMYTVNHKKRDILFLTIILAWLILTDFYSFYIILIMKKFCMRL